MSYNSNFEIAVVAINLLVLTSFFLRGMTNGYHNRVFLSLITTATAAAIAKSFYSIAGKNALYLFLLCNISYSLDAAILPLIALFVIAVTGRRETFHRKDRIQFSSPYIIYIICIWIINPITEIFYSVEYHDIVKGPLYPLIKLIFVYYLAIAVQFAYKYRKNIRKSSYISLVCAFPVIVLTTLIECINPHMLIMDLGISTSILIYTMLVQRPEEILDVETGLNKIGVFMNDIKSILIARKKISIYFMKIENYTLQTTKLKIDDHVKFVRAIAKGMRAVVAQNGKEIDLYYLNNGIFAFWFSEAYRGKIDDVVDTAVRIVQRNIELTCKGFDYPSFYECIANIPEDISDYGSISPFLESMEKIIPKAGKAYHLSDLKGRESLRIHMNGSSIIERALQNNDVVVSFEPIYSSESRRIVGAEAIANINDTQHGSLDCETIMDVAARADLTSSLTNCIYEKVCNFVSSGAFKEAGMQFVTMKLSNQPLRNQYLVRDLMKITTRYKIKPENIIFELTGDIGKTEWEEILSQTRLLKFKGFKVALGNYGGRNASIKRVTAFPISYVKFDADLVRNAEMSSPLSTSLGEEYMLSPAEVVLQSFTEMMKRLGIAIVAGGVDDEQAMLRIEQLECEFAQGKNIGKPMLQTDFFRHINQFNQKREGWSGGTDS